MNWKYLGLLVAGAVLGFGLTAMTSSRYEFKPYGRSEHGTFAYAALDKWTGAVTLYVPDPRAEASTMANLKTGEVKRFSTAYPPPPAGFTLDAKN